jgi:competence ComEA-like helix-hairpin-helix protein
MPSEHRAALCLLALGLVGQVTRVVLSDPGTAPGDVRLLGAVGSSAVLARRDSLQALDQALGPGQRIDIDVAPARELVRLPGVGPVLAQRIVAEREHRGPFGDFVALTRVKGVGPSLIAQMAPHLAFSGAVAALPAEDTTKPRRKRSRRALSQSAGATQPAPPLVLRPSAGRSVTSAHSPSHAKVQDVLNTGSVAELDRLPGIGPVRAERIVAFRDSAGRFRGPDDLARVPGISLALARRLWTAGGSR